MIEIHKSVGRPQAGPEIFAGDDLAGALKEHRQNPEGLLLEAHPQAVAANLAGGKVGFKDSKADNAAIYRAGWHLDRPRVPGSFGTNGRSGEKVPEIARDSSPYVFDASKVSSSSGNEMRAFSPALR